MFVPHDATHIMFPISSVRPTIQTLYPTSFRHSSTSRTVPYSRVGGGRLSVREEGKKQAQRHG